MVRQLFYYFHHQQEISNIKMDPVPNFPDALSEEQQEELVKMENCLYHKVRYDFILILDPSDLIFTANRYKVVPSDVNLNVTVTNNLFCTECA